MPQAKAVSAEYNSKGQYVGSRAVDRQDKPPSISADSDQEKLEKSELDNAKEWDRPSILKMQAERRAAKAAKPPAAAPTASPAKSEPESAPKASGGLGALASAIAKKRAAEASASPTPKK